ncbi:glycerol-3-phosphate acyltransferase [Deinococcus sonorensis]|uniref:Glycerol-3-phosphate acyltransferase n=2 Tax=Deinococcus sonorensis TaxID=309891 RepID=A0AAU7U8F2_9DEIO
MSSLPVSAAVLLGSYLIGSLVMGVLYSRLRGTDIRDKDLPGASGTFRQYGAAAGATVMVLDFVKGMVAVGLARYFAPDAMWLAVFGVVLGHCYPVYFRFNGGAGVAPFGGAFLVASPIAAIPTYVLALALIPVYKRTLQPRLKMNAVPAVSVAMLPIGIVFSLLFGGLVSFLAGGVVMVLRGLQMLRSPEREA